MKFHNFVLIILIISLQIFNVQAAEKASVKYVKGAAHAIRLFKKVPLTNGTELQQKDMLVTKEAASLQVELPDGSFVNVGPSSKLKMAKFLKTTGKPRSTSLELIKGAGKFKVKKLQKEESFIIKTPVAVAGVRGTEFIVQHQTGKGGKAKSSVSVVSGRVEVKSRSVSPKAKPVSVGKLEQSSVSADAPPSKPIKLTVKQVQAVESSAGVAGPPPEPKPGDKQGAKAGEPKDGGNKGPGGPPQPGEGKDGEKGSAKPGEGEAKSGEKGSDGKGAGIGPGGSVNEVGPPPPPKPSLKKLVKKRIQNNFRQPTRNPVEDKIRENVLQTIIEQVINKRRITRPVAPPSNQQ